MRKSGGRNYYKRNSGRTPGRKNRPDAPPKRSGSGAGIPAFLELGLSELAAGAADYMGFVEPTEVQNRVIPPLVEGKDVIACSETGSGKTASFVLPILDLLDFSSSRIQTLVLVPTRELCQQVAEAFRDLGAGHRLWVAEIFGGVSYGGQRNQLAKKPQVVVGTPGRVMDLLDSRTMNFSKVGILVLDEADRMLDMGFLPQIRKVLSYVPQERQTLMFSATIPDRISHFSSFCKKDPVNILIGHRARPPDQVVQEAVDLLVGEKDAKLLETVGQEPGSILVFTSTKSRANMVYQDLKRAGHKVCVMHSGWSQSERKRAIDGFGSGRYRIMVATDVAQRGLDIEGISLVINYDLPTNPEDYVHRIGRTGRANAAGRALSFVTYHDYTTLKAIQKLTGHKFKNFRLTAKSNFRRFSARGGPRRTRRY